MTGRVSRVLSGRAGLPAVRGAAYHLGERQPELGAEHGVDDRVERRVEVAQPQEEAGHVLVDDALLAQGHDQGHDEERQPADDERAGDNGQRFGRFPFAFRLQRFLFLALRLHPATPCYRRHAARSVHVHLDHRMPTATAARSGPGRRVRHHYGGLVVVNRRLRQLQMMLVLVVMVVRTTPGIVVGGDGERGGDFVFATATTGTVARFRTTTSAATAAATAVLRRFRHRTARMAVDQPDAGAHGCFFHVLFLLDPQEHGLPEETAFFWFRRCRGRCSRCRGRDRCLFYRRLFQPGKR